MQNPLSAPASKVGPLSSDAKTAYITVRFDVQPSTLGDGYLHGVDDAVQPCGRPASTSSTADSSANSRAPPLTTG